MWSGRRIPVAHPNENFSVWCSRKIKQATTQLQSDSPNYYAYARYISYLRQVG